MSDNVQKQATPNASAERPVLTRFIDSFNLSVYNKRTLYAFCFVPWKQPLILFLRMIQKEFVKPIG